MKTVFITFGAGTKEYEDAAERIIQQAARLQIFDDIIKYTEQDLQNDKEFWSKHGDFIGNNKRGYGYWIWKPYIVKRTMDTLADDDILMYLDCGCELDIRKKKKIIDCIQNTQHHDMVATINGFIRDWTKMDTLIHFQANKPPYINSPMLQAGACVYKINRKIKEFANEWYETACIHHLLDDSDSVNRNLPTFRENRHDQSIFSLLIVKYSIRYKPSLGQGVDIIRNRTGNTRLV